MPKVIGMGNRRTLKQIITENGSSAMARKLRYNQSYLSKVGRGKSSGSVELIGRALGAFGPELDVEASIREMVPEEVAAGGHAGEEVDHEQP